MKVLVDTSVWIQHFKKQDPYLSELLFNNRVLIHPFVLGEVFIGHVKKRKEVLELLSYLPKAETLSTEEVLTLITNKSLLGTGLGWIDCHLLASALVEKADLYTLDKALQKNFDRIDR
ncbi:MAG TPA: PIN domain-containing protein [Bdellovibrio sp.]|nr:PIN domain-containing protein [Bdellovibrio sp.]